MSNEAIARELAALRPLIDELVWQLGSLLGGSVSAGFVRGDLDNLHDAYIRSCRQEVQGE